MRGKYKFILTVILLVVLLIVLLLTFNISSMVKRIDLMKSVAIARAAEDYPDVEFAVSGVTRNLDTESSVTIALTDVNDSTRVVSYIIHKRWNGDGYYASKFGTKNLPY